MAPILPRSQYVKNHWPPAIENRDPVDYKARVIVT